MPQQVALRWRSAVVFILGAMLIGATHGRRTLLPASAQCCTARVHVALAWELLFRVKCPNSPLHLQLQLTSHGHYLGPDHTSVSDLTNVVVLAGGGTMATAQAYSSAELALLLQLTQVRKHCCIEGSGVVLLKNMWML